MVHRAVETLRKERLLCSLRFWLLLLRLVVSLAVTGAATRHVTTNALGVHQRPQQHDRQRARFARLSPSAESVDASPLVTSGPMARREPIQKGNLRPMTAEDYANIQRMIDASLRHAAGISGEVEPGTLCTMGDLDAATATLESDLRQDWQDDIADIRTDLNHTQNDVTDLQDSI